MEHISIQGLEFYGYHGVFPEENKAGQTFMVDCDLFFSFNDCIKNDNFDNTVDYGAVCYFITEYLGKKNKFKLIETACRSCADQILINFPRVEKIKLRLYKPEAPVKLSFSNISVCVERTWHMAYLSIGSNIGNTKGYLEGAIEELKNIPGVEVLSVAPFITTSPYGGVEQDDFLNSALKVRTILSAEELLDKIHSIENMFGRTREIHWGPRTLDIDIVFYDSDIISTDNLVVPHIDMQNRKFVLEPLKEIAPNFRHPILGLTVTEMLNNLK